LVQCRLEKQRDHLFVFLDHEKVPATNNRAENDRAERQLRPAVIRRKLSCTGRTPRGAQAFERMRSVLETCVQKERSVLDCLTATMSLGMEAPSPSLKQVQCVVNLVIFRVPFVHPTRAKPRPCSA
jgi:hypothetical protein